LAAFRIAAEKYQRLGPSFPLTGVRPPDQDLLDRVHAQFQAYGVTTI
jgi:pyruvate formate lyase activating enzyme